MLTAQSKKCCEKVFDVSRIMWFIIDRIYTDEGFEYTIFYTTYFYHGYSWFLEHSMARMLTQSISESRLWNCIARNHGC